MSRAFLTKDGRSGTLRQIGLDDAQEFVAAVDSVAREQIYFLRSKFDIDVVKEKAFLAQAVRDGNLVLGAILEGQIVGWVTVFRARHEFRQHVGELGMGVIAGFRDIGIGATLMEAALAWAGEHGFEKVNLGVRTSNHRARALYERFGFVQEGHRAREIKDLDGCYHDSLEMACTVPQGEREA